MVRIYDKGEIYCVSVTVKGKVGNVEMYRPIHETSLRRSRIYI